MHPLKRTTFALTVPYIILPVYATEHKNVANFLDGAITSYTNISQYAVTSAVSEINKGLSRHTLHKFMYHILF